jgi:hypothetical protein
VAQTRNFANEANAATAADAVPDSFDLQSQAADNVAGVGTASCADASTANQLANADESVGIGGNVFCGDLLAATDGDETPGVITCNYRYCKVANTRKSWLGAPLLKFGLFEKHTKFEKNLRHGLDIY